MEVTFAALADAANISQEGKLNITGIFGRVFALSLPATHPGATLVIIVEAAPDELGDHHLEARFVDEEGNRLMQLDLDFNVNPPNPDRVSQSQILLRLAQIPLPAEGEYSFDIFIDGRYRYSVPLVVTLPGTNSAT